MNTNSLTTVEKIEYYLGKDRLPNLHWQAEIPPSWQIPVRRGDVNNFCNPSIAGKSYHADGCVYTFNKLGYRSDFEYHVSVLKKKNVVLLLGDSDTFARRISFDDMYSTKLRQLTNYYVINLGIAGISADGMVRVGAQTIQALGSAVKHVCVLWPVPSMREFVSKKYSYNVHNFSDLTPYPDWWDHIDWVSNNYNYQKNRLLIQQITQNYGAQYHDLFINRHAKNTPIGYISDPTNVFIELDNTSHTAIANYFFRKINNQPSLFEQLKTQS
jgi:hypothetical protein